MKQAFLDSSIIVAACASKRGASALILGYCRQKKVQGFISLTVIGEARKNVIFKLGKIGKERLVYFLKHANLKLTEEPSLAETVVCETVIHPKDAPILAAAVKNKVKFLITLDKKHFMQNQVLHFVKPLIIISPGEFVQKYL